MGIRVYSMRIDNSIGDLVRFKKPEGIYELDQVTPKSQEWLDLAFPYCPAVLYCHTNPNDATNRMVYLYCNPYKPRTELDHEKSITNFEMSPRKLFDQFKNHNYEKFVAYTSLDNLEYIIPNLVKRDKIMNDGKTYCFVKDLSSPRFPDVMKNRLKQFNYEGKSEADVTDLTKLGLITNVDWEKIYPVEVKWPNGQIDYFATHDLMYAHEV